MDQRERDACGIGFVASIRSAPSHGVVELALTALANHAHRGALAADGKTGDGAGLLIQLPYGFFAREFERLHSLPPPARQDFAVGVVFGPQVPDEQVGTRAAVEEALRAEGLAPLGWRVVPIDVTTLGRHARRSCPAIEQVFVGRGESVAVGAPFEEALYKARKRVRKISIATGQPQVYLPSLSSRTITYKALVQAPQLGAFYPDLKDPQLTSQLAVFHQRYSTNTYTTWRLAQPFRLVCHNGEINTLQGNFNWMRAREAAFKKLIWGDQPDVYANVISRTNSDSAMFDNALELFVRQGYDVCHALLMMVPEAWENLSDNELPGAWRSFYRYHESLMEPWDGPAALAFSDGRHVGMAVDRNGLRPARFTVTTTGLIVASSETGAIEIPNKEVLKHGMLAPGQILAVDTQEGRIRRNNTIKDLFAHARPYGTLVQQRYKRLRRATRLSPDRDRSLTGQDLHTRRLALGHTQEHHVTTLIPMVLHGVEPTGAMGDDTPLAVLSAWPQPLSHFFHQRFAQVTNPPIDSIRERTVMSLRTYLGARGNVLNPDDEHVRLLELDDPILDPQQFALVCSHSGDKAFRPVIVDATFAVAAGRRGLVAAIEAACDGVEGAIGAGSTLVVLSDRNIDAQRTSIPSLLLTSAVHQRLISKGLRLRASLIIDTGQVSTVHDLACLLGFGADAIYPYMLFATCSAFMASGSRRAEGLSASRAMGNIVHALSKGLLKIMAKMGIAPLSSYRGAQVFECVGLSEDVVSTYFPDTKHVAGGYDLDQLTARLAGWHTQAYSSSQPAKLPSFGLHKYNKRGEVHAFAPPIVRQLHAALGLNPKRTSAEQQVPEHRPGELTDAFAAYTAAAEAQGHIAVRDLLGWNSPNPPIDLTEVEPATAITKRFSTGAMSHGALSTEAHETLARAMAIIGGLSNSGEGGEAPQRYADERNSTIKQVASGRFGVTAAYLGSGVELQIKMAQGSKPGEGGQLPGRKVTQEIARIRHTTPGVSLISPPPHHDIYSIEDLSQLIYDLKQVNPRAYVSVKLVAESGVGTIAAGVAKGYADVIHIGGHAGGTGASPLSAIKHAGLPWEFGLAEAQRVLMENRLRERVRLRVDGGLRTASDVVIAALLGADEYSFGTVALIAEGCVMARTCHTNTCPVGVATQDPKLRARFPGRPEQVAHFFLQLAEGVRRILAELGCRSMDELIGRVEYLHERPHADDGRWLHVAWMLEAPRTAVARRRRLTRNDPPSLGYSLGETLAARLIERLDGTAGPVRFGADEPLAIRNTDRTVGARVASSVVERFGARGLAPGRIHVRFAGTAGQSFAAFLPQGVAFELTGAANDYVGKGLCGGHVAIRRPPTARFKSHKNAIVGNTVLYGATGGRLFAAGRAGARLCVRNSGAVAVVEGAGDHCCEYMTGGVCVILGRVGRNFGAGMTGGVAYIYDEHGQLLDRLNGELVEANRLTDQAHEDKLRALIEAHCEHTASERARFILDHWDELVVRFWRVAPRAIATAVEAGNFG